MQNIASKLDPRAVVMFWERVEKTLDGCWRWKGFINNKGYGQFSVSKSKTDKDSYKVHRVSYLIHKGDIPDGFDVHHTCRNRGCPNPAHLGLQPHKNHEGSASFGNSDKTHCNKGHEFTPQNTYIGTRPDGRTFRKCRACGRAARTGSTSSSRHTIYTRGTEYSS